MIWWTVIKRDRPHGYRDGAFNFPLVPMNNNILSKVKCVLEDNIHIWNRWTTPACSHRFFNPCSLETINTVDAGLDSGAITGLNRLGIILARRNQLFGHSMRERFTC